MSGVGIIGLGKAIPDNIVTNLDLEKKMDTSDEWIWTRTGIRERRIAPDDMSVTDMAYIAASEAIADANLTPEDIDLILVATVTSNERFPSVACLLQERLGAKSAAAMDISAACTGFVYGVVTAAQFVKAGSYKNVLVIGAEKLSSLIDWNDRSTAVLFGDSAGAAVISNVADNRGILSFELGADGSGAKHIFVGEKGIVMNGREVFKFAVRQMGDSCVNTLALANLGKEDVDLFVPHQANIRIIDSARERLDLPPEKVANTIAKYGNTSAATIPVALAEKSQAGEICDDDLIVLVAFGAGLTWGAICMRWGK